MSSLWQLPAVIVFLASWLASPPAGLADVAQREAFRRLATQKSQATLTNLGLPQEPVPPARAWSVCARRRHHRKQPMSSLPNPTESQTCAGAR